MAIQYERYFTANILVQYTVRKAIHPGADLAFIELGYLKCIKRIDDKLYGFVVFKYNNDIDNWRAYTAERCDINKLTLY